MEKKKKIHAIIHTATLSAGGIGAGLAQLPGADMPVLTALQTAMIIAIGHEHGCDITKASAKSLLLTFPGSYGGRALAQYLLGWLPGYGNVINASTACFVMFFHQHEEATHLLGDKGRIFGLSFFNII